ncbi:Zinc finger, RING/FYVE/PHD-type [Phytophthora cactorum]|nr:Zinc finger, RING/FYVE/PHD-type [Phytophthora cactorum]
MSDSFIQEAVHMSRHYAGCSRHPSAIDPTRWKRIAHVRDLAMYKERRARWRLGSKRKLGSRLANKEYVDDSTKLLPATLMIGTFPGDLESVMFGLQSSTEDATRLRASYLGDNLVDEKLLAVPLESPSYDNPLRSCTLRWRGLRSGTAAAKVASGKIFSSRAIETVYIESTGITELGNGERVGYELLQSVESTDTSQPKAGGSCAECFRSFGRWPHRAERQCSACDERVCASCTAYRQMRFALPFRRKVTRSKLAFCGRCLQRAEETSPLTVAAFEAMEQGEDFDFDTFDSSMPPLSHPLKWSSQCLDVDDDLAMTILGD